MAEDAPRQIPTLAERVQSLLDDRDDALALAASIDERMKQMRERKERLKDTADSLLRQIANALEAEGMPSLRLPEATVSLKQVPPSVEITDEDAVPPSYWRVKPETRELDKKALLEDLKQGVIVDGAMLSNGGTTVQIRRS